MASEASEGSKLSFCAGYLVDGTDLMWAGNNSVKAACRLCRLCRLCRQNNLEYLRQPPWKLEISRIPGLWTADRMFEACCRELIVATGLWEP